jgi:hypothetical protein
VEKVILKVGEYVLWSHLGEGWVVLFAFIFLCLEFLFPCLSGFIGLVWPGVWFLLCGGKAGPLGKTTEQKSKFGLKESRYQGYMYIVTYYNSNPK